MRTDVIHFNACNANKLGMLAAQHGGSNRRSVEQMRGILMKAVNTELTELQRYCLTERYLNCKKQKDIARELGLNASTVCRHIAAAERKLRNIASYYN